jgi:hypothetical protein
MIWNWHERTPLIAILRGILPHEVQPHLDALERLLVSWKQVIALIH